MFDWATIGDAGNAADSEVMDIDGTTGYGSVGYEFRIAKTEVTNAQYVEFLNDVAVSQDWYGLYNEAMSFEIWGGIIRTGTAGSYSYAVKPDAIGQGPGGSDYSYADKPVTFVSWFDAIRFANWMTSGDTERGTYNIDNGGVNFGFVTIPDHSTLGPGSFFLPTEDEWYKAAYYDGAGGYYDYPTSTNTPPDNNLPFADSGNSANLMATGDIFYAYTDVGSYSQTISPYAVFDMAGNVYEWNEALVTPTGRGIRGGGYDSLPSEAASWARSWNLPHSENTVTGQVGFRIAGSFEAPVPEPSTYAMAALGLWGLAFYGRRRRRDRQRAFVR
ncbi:MAG: PEP-CTERM sorting domain-containing protein [Planctomycetota bacterium]|nr:MAG: PEP-CTERM sorting domain-containing protein [Planctomycetota bacterium]REJ89417.1 MAG: PEP-CTERM sorting domain-containing protein [Planctomycetota bacterium]REK26215.1 MAG: PEP-CTERM sorting domain-containing protein [Planctomycetota bacterium]REK44547.1 MAG: PEP-CTERM sorting domain-containing protein [Planctomycetota bacterium]